MNPRQHSYTMKKALLDDLAFDASKHTLAQYGASVPELKEWLSALLDEARAAGCPAARMADGRLKWDGTPRMTGSEMAA